ncbi:MAG: NAD(P)-binding domain-containing protein [Vicinamibacterales bacterium]
MIRTDCVVIGGGQAGLAMSRCLARRRIAHVVLERGRVAERWQSERWDSLRLLTPNWQSRLPGWHYTGPDPDGYMTMAEITTYLQEYGRSFGAPVETGTAVRAVARGRTGFVVSTDRATYGTPAVVIATGHCDRPRIPRAAAGLARGLVVEVTPRDYRRPAQLPPGGVLVVGASASGVQLAEELHRSGRPVTLAAGHHTRLPRRYRGRDILWWFDRMGIFSETTSEVFDVAMSRGQPSLQLVGRPDHGSIDLAGLQALGIRVTGRLLGIDGRHVRFDDDLIATTAAADVKLATLLARIDRFSAAHDGALDLAPAEPFEPIWPRFAEAPASLDLGAERISTVVWATGYRRTYPWLHVPVLDEQGDVRHQDGLTPEPGLYALGLNFLRRRNSSFIDGVGADAELLAADIHQRLDRRRSVVA